MCDADRDYPPYPDIVPGQLTLEDAPGATPDPQPAERVKCGFPGCRFYATATFAGPSFEPRCDHHATAKVRAVAQSMGYTLVGASS